MIQKFSRYERQTILKQIGREGQQKLDQAKVAIIGLGALGSVSANILARAGVGNIVLIDRDFLEINNLQRQVLYDEKDLQENLPKAIVAEHKLRQVNSEINIVSQVSDVNVDTIDKLLADVDLIVDGTDNFETRFLINDYALKHGKPWIYGGAIQTEGMSYVILPNNGPCLRCLFGEKPGSENRQTCDQVGILAPVAHLVASIQAVEAIKILADKVDDVERKLWKVDVWTREFKAITVDHLKETPCESCGEKKYPYLTKKEGFRSVQLCGRNAVQISERTSQKNLICFDKLASKLKDLMRVEHNRYLLRCFPDACEITVFANGRAIIKGTEDVSKAKGLYAKYIGN